MNLPTIRVHARSRRALQARTTLSSVVAVFAVGALDACDPCTGVVGCSVDARVGIGGQIVDRGQPSQADGAPLSGAGIPLARPVAGVRVEVVPTGGALTGATPVSARTDDAGWWHVDLPADGEGSATVDVVVSAPGSPSYRVRGVSVRASSRRGEGAVVGRWTREPYIAKLGEVINWPSGVRLEGSRVRAIRRGGVEVAPTRNTADPIITTAGGRFLFEVRPLGDGPVLYDFVIERDGLPTATVRNVRITPQWEWLPPNVSGELIFYLTDAGTVAF